MPPQRPLGFIRPDAILPDLRVKTREEAIHALMACLGAVLPLTAEQQTSAIAALLKREELGSTGIGQGLALPHCTVPFVNEVVGALALTREGVDFASIDRRPAHLIVLLLAPVGDPGARLRALERASHFVRRPRLYPGDLFRCRTPEEIVAFMHAAEDNPAEAPHHPFHSRRSGDATNQP
jgi:PTS system fructose-specific IIA component/PTS system nitrogen regulatory IIA component